MHCRQRGAGKCGCNCCFCAFDFARVVGIGVVNLEKAIARLEMGETVVEEVEAESLALIETLYAETESTASDPKITC